MPKKFTDLVELTALANDDIVPVVDTSANTNKKVTVATLKQALSPAGVIAMFGSNTAPSGWLICDGSPVSRTTYADLFAAISTSYGVGDGTSTFNLPNLKGRVPVGRDAVDAQFDALGETGGAKTHVLTTAEMPAHNHPASADTQGNHTHGYVKGTYVLIQVYSSQDANRTMINTEYTENTSAAGNHSHNISTSNTGGGTAHNNLQPYVVVNYIIKS